MIYGTSRPYVIAWDAIEAFETRGDTAPYAAMVAAYGPEDAESLVWARLSIRWASSEALRGAQRQVDHIRAAWQDKIAEEGE